MSRTLLNEPAHIHLCPQRTPSPSIPKRNIKSLCSSRSWYLSVPQGTGGRPGVQKEIPKPAIQTGGPKGHGEQEATILLGTMAGLYHTECNDRSMEKAWQDSKGDKYDHYFPARIFFSGSLFVDHCWHVCWKIRHIAIAKCNLGGFE